MKKNVALLFIIVLISCQEQITPIVQLNEDSTENPGEDPGEEPEGCELPAFTPVTGKYANCIPETGTSTFDVVTWNIENYPKSTSATPALVAEIVQAMNADVIAVQEISNASNFTTLANSIPGYAGIIPNQNNGLKVGYLYKTSEVTINSSSQIYTDDACAFPRPPFVLNVTHVSGLQVTLINLHLKCCDGSNTSCGSDIDRRKSASTKLKTYIDENLSTANVIVLGDFNEDITEPEGNGVFTNFKSDPANYEFADMTIAECSSAYWSYPSWPSQLDHLLITNELFTKVSDVRVVRLNECESGYYNTVSDHRPVLLRLQ